MGWVMGPPTRRLYFVRNVAMPEILFGQTSGIWPLRGIVVNDYKIRSSDSQSTGFPNDADYRGPLRDQGHEGSGYLRACGADPSTAQGQVVRERQVPGRERRQHPSLQREELWEQEAPFMQCP